MFGYSDRDQKQSHYAEKADGPLSPPTVRVIHLIGRDPIVRDRLLRLVERHAPFAHEPAQQVFEIVLPSRAPAPRCDVWLRPEIARVIGRAPDLQWDQMILFEIAEVMVGVAVFSYLPPLQVFCVFLRRADCARPAPHTDR